MRKSCFLLPLMTICIGLACVEKNFAWGKTWLGRDLETQVGNAGFSLGPFRTRVQLILSSVGYDSNVYYGATAEPIKDYTFTGGLALNIYLPLKKRIIFHIHESPQYVYFKETERERAWNNYLQGRVHFIFNRIVVAAGVGRSEAKQRWNTETDIPVFRKEESVEGLVFWQPASKTSLNLSYRMARYAYGESDLGTFGFAIKLNRDESYFNFTAYREISLRTRFFVSAEYAFFDFANPVTLKNSKSYGGYGGLEFSPFGRIRGSVKVGYKKFNSQNPERKDFNGIVGDSTVAVRLMRVLNARASYRRDIQFSIWYDSTYFLESRAGAGASIYVSRNIRLDYDYSLGRNDYPVEFGVQKRRDDYQIHSIGIYFRLMKNTAFGIIASRWVRNSNLDWEDDNRDFAGFNLTYDF